MKSEIQVLFIVAIVAFVGVIIEISNYNTGNNNINSDSSGSAYLSINQKASDSVDAQDVQAKSELIAGTTTAMQAEYISFNFIIRNGVPPYHDVSLYCGNGDIVPMEIMASGPLYDIYTSNCRYARTGKYTVYAEAFDDSKPQISNGDPYYNRILSNEIIITITPKITISGSPYAEITSSDNNIKQGQQTSITFKAYNAELPLRILTFYCGSEIKTFANIEDDTFTTNCEYPSRGSFTVYAQAEDFIYENFESNELTITVVKSGGGGGGGSGGGSGGGGVVCIPNWECTAWGTCINNVQLRSCTDLSDCGTVSDRPEETNDCTSTVTEPEPIITPEPEPDYQEPDESTPPTTQTDTDSVGRTLLWIMFVFFIIACLILYLRWVIPERQRYTKYISTMKKNVNTARAKGHSEEKIHKNLLAQGHKLRHIKKAMK